MAPNPISTSVWEAHMPDSGLDKSSKGILALGAMVGLVVMALFVLYFLPDPQPSNIDPTLNKIQDAVTIAKDLCLSGKKVEALTDIEAYVSDKAKAKASLGREEAKGAVD